jgi:hypothetical protein
MNRMNPAATSPITPSTRATVSSGRWRLKKLTATPQHASIVTHSSIEPSCEPQDAAILYGSGSSELEFVATFSTEKSLVTNEWTRHSHAKITNANWPRATGRASAIHSRMPLCAPTSGSVPCTSASSSARISEKCPSSGTM